MIPLDRWKNDKKIYVSLNLREYLFWIMGPVLWLIIGSVQKCSGVTLVAGAGW